MREADLSNEQFADDCNPEGEDEEDVAHSNLVVTWKLVGLPSYLWYVETNREDDSGETEENH